MRQQCNTITMPQYANKSLLMKFYLRKCLPQKYLLKELVFTLWVFYAMLFILLVCVGWRMYTSLIYVNYSMPLMTLFVYILDLECLRLNKQMYLSWHFIYYDIGFCHVLVTSKTSFLHINL